MIKNNNLNITNYPHMDIHFWKIPTNIVMVVKYKILKTCNVVPLNKVCQHVNRQCSVCVVWRLIFSTCAFTHRRRIETSWEPLSHARGRHAECPPL